MGGSACFMFYQIKGIRGSKKRNFFLAVFRNGRQPRRVSDAFWQFAKLSCSTMTELFE